MANSQVDHQRRTSEAMAGVRYLTWLETMACTSMAAGVIGGGRHGLRYQGSAAAWRKDWHTTGANFVSTRPAHRYECVVMAGPAAEALATSLRYQRPPSASAAGAAAAEIDAPLRLLLARRRHREPPEQHPAAAAAVAAAAAASGRRTLCTNSNGALVLCRRSAIEGNQPPTKTQQPQRPPPEELTVTSSVVGIPDNCSQPDRQLSWPPRRPLPWSLDLPAETLGCAEKVRRWLESKAAA